MNSVEHLFSESQFGSGLWQSRTPSPQSFPKGLQALGTTLGLRVTDVSARDGSNIWGGGCYRGSAPPEKFFQVSRI